MTQPITKKLEWSENKNQWLIKNRGISFEEVVSAINKNNILDDKEHPKLINQRLMIVTIKNYACVIPYVEDENKLFFKTIYQSRKYTKKYLRKNEKI